MDQQDKDLEGVLCQVQENIKSNRVTYGDNSAQAVPAAAPIPGNEMTENQNTAIESMEVDEENVALQNPSQSAQPSTQTPERTSSLRKRIKLLQSTLGTITTADHYQRWRAVPMNE